MKKLVGVLFLVLVIGIIFSKNLLIEIGLEKSLTGILGVETEISSVKAGIRNSDITINDLYISNPGSYKDKKMAHFPRIYLKVNVPSLFKKQVNFIELYLYLSELYLIRSEKGVLNVDALKIVNRGPNDYLLRREKTGKKRPFSVNKLHLKADKVFYQNYAKGNKPETYEIKLNIDKKYSDVKDLYVLLRTVVIETKKHEKMSRIFGLPVSGFKQLASAAYEVSESTVEKAVQAAGAGANTVFNKNIDKNEKLQ